LTSYIPALEAIETVDAVTNSFDAETGLAGGAAVNVHIKSGLPASFALSCSAAASAAAPAPSARLCVSVQ
jgi:hypothetical protein